MTPASHGRVPEFAYFHCGECDESKAYRAYTDHVPTWRCGCGDLATFLGWGADGEAQAKRGGELRREASAAHKRIGVETRRASMLAASVLEGVRSTIMVGRDGLKSQAARGHFDQLVCDGLRQMIGEE